MPQLGKYPIPNRDINKVSELIIEIGERYSKLEEGVVSEGTFQSEIVKREGGTYTSYKYDMRLYGFIEKIERGQVRITRLFLDIASPTREEDRERAKAEAVRNVQLLRDMYEDGFTDSFSEDDLRMWLVEKKSVPRSEIDKKKLESVRKLYIVAFPYFKMTKEGYDMEKGRSAGIESGEASSPSVPPTPEEALLPETLPKNVEEFKFGDIRIWIPKEGEKVQKLREKVKEMLDIYLGIEDTEKTQS